MEKLKEKNNELEGKIAGLESDVNRLQCNIDELRG